MLGALAKYIFGGMMGDAPETTAPELQYHTREVNDWLLVDMPDQAIDDEDLDSESDDDDILTALPLLMAEEIVQPVQKVQSFEEMKDYSVCDNSYDKVQRCDVDKIHSVPSAVQHHSGDKNQGNFVDNIEALSFEVEDNFPDKIQDISADIQENSDNIFQDISADIQENSDNIFQDISVDIQENSNNIFQDISADIQKNSDNIFQDISVEVQENSDSIIHDISADIYKKNSDNIVQDESVAQIWDTLIETQSNYLDDVQEVSIDQSVLPKVQNIFDSSINPITRIRGISLTENNLERFRSILRELEEDAYQEAQRILNKTVRDEDFEDEINSVYSEDQDDSEDQDFSEDHDFSNDKTESNLVVDKVQKTSLMTKYLSDEDRFQAVIACGLKKINQVQESLDALGLNLNEREESIFPRYYTHEVVDFTSAPKRLYSQVVRMGTQNQEVRQNQVISQVPTDPMKDIFSNELGKNYDRCVRIFGDEIQESSDDEMNETSDDEMNENSSDEMNENSDVEEENSKDGTTGKLYSTKTQLSSDEESDEYSEDESPDTFVDFHKRFHFVPRRNKELTDGRKGIIKEKIVKIMGMVLNHDTGCIPHAEYEHVVGFRNIPQCWYAYQTMQEPLLHALLVRNYYLYEPTGRCPHLKAFLCKNVINKKLKRRLPVEEKPATVDSSLITNSAEILQNLINQKSTILPTKTGVVLEHIKELKPVQQAIQLENRKYLTRSQLNRQNRNNMYQSSTKANRRRNLQRNHSGANNNRKC